MGVGRLGCGKAEKQDGGDTRGDGHGTFPTDVLDVDHVESENRAEKTGHGRDGVVTVGLVCGGRRAEILGQEGVEQSVSHADGGPAEPDENG